MSNQAQVHFKLKPLSVPTRVGVELPIGAQTAYQPATSGRISASDVTIPLESLDDAALESLVQQFITGIYDAAKRARPRTITLPFLDVIVTETPGADSPSSNEVIESLTKAVEQAQLWFQGYADMHRDNGKPEKAQANQDRANFFALVKRDPMYGTVFVRESELTKKPVTETPLFCNTVVAHTGLAKENDDAVV